jgi:uncharacterized protein YigE (DUF2233 family)
MPKKSISVIFVSLIFLGFTAYFLTNNADHRMSEDTSTEPASTASTSPTAASYPYHTLKIDGETIAYGFMTIPPMTDTLLVPNFAEKRLSKEIAVSNGCMYYANGSFYDTENRPLGLFRTGTVILKSATQNPLINAFIWRNTSGQFLISKSIPPEDSKWALQTGPLLLNEGIPLSISVRNDEYARRMVAGVDHAGSIVFFVVFGVGQFHTGPTLESLPDIIHAISRKERLGIDTAVNLDGGSASAYSDGRLTMEELTPVGSLFCIRK